MEGTAQAKRGGREAGGSGPGEYGWERREGFQSLSRSFRMAREWVPTPLDGGFVGLHGLPSRGRGREGLGVQ